MKLFDVIKLHSILKVPNGFKFKSVLKVFVNIYVNSYLSFIFIKYIL